MENTNSQPKQQAVDGQSAYAGNPNPTPDHNSIDMLSEQAGLDMSAGEDLQVKEKLDERDDDRWELDPGSAEDHPSPTS
ncbi:hypothetical protein IQ241_17255 [Romeria aff. gracilis LEGE 07310]|uniref:Uncharacterized protein n=2 Tax=Vasconcelosia TaxID=3366328 RepID=A0A8J7AX46_9CYAN|nr:hypothetical protein [Romeria aff. gracilis LEGE 07310]